MSARLADHDRAAAMRSTLAHAAPMAHTELQAQRLELFYVVNTLHIAGEFWRASAGEGEDSAVRMLSFATGLHAAREALEAVRLEAGLATDPRFDNMPHSDFIAETLDHAARFVLEGESWIAAVSAARQRLLDLLAMPIVGEEPGG